MRHSLRMKIRFLARVEEGGAPQLWQRRAERPYPGVPRSGDSVFLGDEGGGEMPWIIEDVTWENDGVITLSLDLGVASVPDLERLGFERI